MFEMAIATLAALWVFTAAQGIRMVRSDISRHYFDDDAETTHQSKHHILRIIDAIGFRFQRILRRSVGASRLQWLDKKLKNAGYPENLTLDLFIQREAGFIFLSVILFLVFALMGRFFIGLAIGVTFSCWMFIWLFRAVRIRQESINRDLPDFLDVLAVTVRAGLSFRSALERVCDHFTGPVSEEMRTTLHEMRLGVTRREAFAHTRFRCESDNVDTFVTTLLQSEELGTPIGDTLSSIVKEIRRERAQQVKRQASKAQPKVSLVATTTMVPGTMILMIGGILYANREAFSGLFGG